MSTINSRFLRSSALALALLTGTSCFGQQSGPGPEPGEAAPSELPALKLIEVANGFEMPLYGAFAPGQASRMYVLEKAGKIRILDLETGKVMDPPFLDFREKINTRSERGLLGLAFAADYESTGAFYIHYSDLDGTTILSRLFRDAKQPLIASAESEEILLTVKQPWANHDGGQLSFGPDGMLYLGLGDGGAANDPKNAAQNGKSLLGKILRMKVSSIAGTPYQIPSDNPFLGSDEFRDEIWCYGLRNPWRFSFDRQNGDLWIGDVGQNAWEEIDFQAASSKGGENYGWRVREAMHEFNRDDDQPENMIEPIHEYAQGGPKNARSVTGGYVYRGKALPALDGWYLFGDYVSGQVWAIREDNGNRSGYLNLSGLLNENGLGYVPGLATFAEDAAGEIYLMSLSGGQIYRLSKN